MIISIAHQKGGVGKSTIAFNLAYYLRKYSPKLIDLDIQNTISYANSIRAQTLIPFEIKIIAKEKELKNIVLASNKNNLFIIDTGGFDSSFNRLSIMIADLIITPVSDKLFEILGLKKFETILSELSKVKKETIKAKVLLNNISPFTKKLENLQKFIEESDNFELMNTIIRQRADIIHSSNKGLAVEEYNINSKSHIEIQQLANEIDNILYLNNV